METWYTSEVHPTRTSDGHKWCAAVREGGVLYTKWEMFFTKREAELASVLMLKMAYEGRYADH